MTAPLSVRLDDDVRTTLVSEAEMRGIGLSSLVREIAADAAARFRRERIRAESEAVARHIASSPEAQEFFADWGTPSGWAALSD